MADPLAEARRALQEGDLRRTKRLLDRVLAAGPTHPDALMLLGIVHFQSGETDLGIEAFTRAHAAAPGRGDLAYNLGVALHQVGRLEPARQALEAARTAMPHAVEVQTQLGLVLEDEGRLDEAADLFRAATASSSPRPEPWLNLGNVLMKLNQEAEALDAWERAAALPGPGGWNAALNLIQHVAVTDPNKALERARALVRVAGNWSLVWLVLGRLEAAAGTPARAMSALVEATRRNPSDAEAWLELARVQRTEKRWVDALASLDQASRAEPQHPEPPAMRARQLQAMGEIEGARSGLSRSSDLGHALLRALLLPVIPGSREEMTRTRERVSLELAQLRERGGSLEDPLRQVGVTAFYLAYHGVNEIQLQREIAETMLQLCPRLAARAADGGEGGLRERVRVGVLSAFLHEHTIGKLFGPMIERLDRERFELVFLHVPSKWDGRTQRVADRADQVIRLSPHLWDAQQQLLACGLDVLFFPEIGMDPMTMYLGYARAARTQVVTWGHPVTTGIPNMDQFLSAEGLELPASDQEYTETLVRLPVLGTVFERPAPPPQGWEFSRLGLPTDRNLYACPQTLFKIHPDFDDVLARILREDSNGLLVMLEGQQAAWGERLRARWRKTDPILLERSVFLSALPHADYLGLCASAAVLLDPLHFGGGMSSLEGFSVGTPIVTLPSTLLRGRITSAQYEQMGWSGGVVRSPDAYVDLAVQWGSNRDAREAASAEIQTRSASLYESAHAQSAFENALKSV